MNERIRELQSKSYLMCKQIVDDDGHVVVTPDQWFDKFAELIVRECMDVASPSYMSTPEQGVYYVEQAIDRIAEHFGVE